MSSTLRLIAALALAVGCTKPAPPPIVDATPPPACGALPDGSRAFRILHLNDIYRIEGLADGRGGVARIRSLRVDLERDCPGAVLVTHAGDALFPSLLSRKFNGEQMIDVLNLLDGAPDAFDPLMVFTPGNHEFDKAKLTDAPMLTARIDQSEFVWLDTNIAWKQGDDGPLVASERLTTRALLDIGGVTVGVFGVTIDAKVPAYVELIDTDYLGIARTQTAELRDEGAEVVIALTHIDAADDRRILEQLGADAPDLVLGGHDHSLQTARIGDRYMLKGDADAVRVRVIDVKIAPDGRVDLRPDTDGVALGPEQPDADPMVQARVDMWLARHAAKFCDEADPSCLDVELTRATTDLIAEEIEIRRFETNLGAWVADRMVETFAEHGAQVAFINSGALRLNQDISAGTPVTRQVIEELFAYPTKMSLIGISGATLQGVLDRSVQEWTGQGHWLQVSGVAFRHDPQAGTATDAHVFDGQAWRPLDPSATYRAVTVRYVLDPGMGDQDGYRMLSLDQVLATPIDGTDLKPIVAEKLEATKAAGFGPEAPGRVCNPTLERPCVLDEG